MKKRNRKTEKVSISLTDKDKLAAIKNIVFRRSAFTKVGDVNSWCITKAHRDVMAAEKPQS